MKKFLDKLICPFLNLVFYEFLKFGFFMSGTIRLEPSVTMPIVFVLFMLICVSLKISFTDISGSTDPILMKFAHLFQWVIWSLNITFQAILVM